MRVATPQFLSDLVRDLRDRRLLPVALGLLAALVAVPVLLSRSAEAPPPLAPTAALPEDASEAQPAVLTEQVGIRDYRKRLEALKSANPFDQQFKPPTVSGAALSDAASLASVPTGTADAAPGEVSTASGVAQTTPQGTGSSAPPPEPEVRFFTRRVDVKVGPVGSLETRKNVRTLTLLPSKRKPVVSYLGTNEGGDQAVFLVSRDVTAVDTDARCMPSPADCEFLVLEEGEDARMDYEADGLTYRLRLLGINTVVLRGSGDTPDNGKRPPLAG